jgi:hypothetical protein
VNGNSVYTDLFIIELFCCSYVFVISGYVLAVVSRKLRGKAFSGRNDKDTRT